MPSQPCSATLPMSARRSGMSATWAMFSRVTSKTIGSSLASRNASTWSRNAIWSGEKSKSTGPPQENLTTRQVSGAALEVSCGGASVGDDAVGDELVDGGVVEAELL